MLLPGMLAVYSEEQVASSQRVIHTALVPVGVEVTNTRRKKIQMWYYRLVAPASL